MFSRISELKSVREEIQSLSERESQLSMPILSDIALIPVIYEYFKEILAEMDCPPCIESVTQRKKFIFIILFLYSPRALIGGRMSSGIRDAIADVVNLSCKTTISNNSADVVFEFHRYKGFRSNIEYLYTEILKRLDIPQNG